MNKELTVKQNYNWIDNAKLLSIFLVILFHTPYDFHSTIGETLGITRMPMFFFLSGLLFKFEKHPSFINFVKHRSRQLLIPYFYFFILIYIYWLLYGRFKDLSSGDPTPIYQPIIEYLLGKPESFNIVMWFIPCLFIIQCMYYLVFKNLNKTSTITLLITTSIIPYFFDLSNTPFSLHSVFIGLCFYGFASLFRQQIINYISKIELYKLVIAAFFLALVYLLATNVINVSSENFTTYYLSLICGFLMIYSILICLSFFSKNSKRINWVKFLTNNAIVILALHTYSNMIIKEIFEKINLIPHTYNEQLIYKITISCITLVALYLPIKFINKYIPFILGRKKTIL